MEERFSTAARMAVLNAEEEAGQLGHGHVGTEHLLLGILAEGDSPAARALVAWGADLNGARIKVAEAVGPERAAGPPRDRAYTDRARRALERASRLSLRRHEPQVTPEHILVSVLDVEGRAGQVLRGLGVDVSGLRAAVEGSRDEIASGASRTAAFVAPLAGTHREKAPPTCGNCGAPLEKTLAHQTMPSPGTAVERGDRGDRGDRRLFVIAFCSACGSALGASAI